MDVPTQHASMVVKGSERLTADMVGRVRVDGSEGVDGRGGGRKRVCGLNRRMDGREGGWKRESLVVMQRVNLSKVGR